MNQITWLVTLLLMTVAHAHSNHSGGEHFHDHDHDHDHNHDHHHEKDHNSNNHDHDEHYHYHDHADSYGSALRNLSSVSAGTAVSYKRCGAKHPTPEERVMDDAFVKAWIANNRFVSSRSSRIVNVDTYFHIITNGADGIITDDEINEQLAVMNAAFQTAGFNFDLKDITRTDNAEWYLGPEGDDDIDDQITLALRKGNASTLNIYLRPFVTLLGYATFPFWYKGKPFRDGVFLTPNSLPGGSPPYDEGDTLVHEVGHWLGLYHVFDDYRTSCKDYDRVKDTPAQRLATFGCPVGQDSCPNEPGLDAINNFMDYSDDSCLNEFSKGQIVRMQALWNKYRNPIKCGRWRSRSSCRRNSCYWRWPKCYAIKP